MTSRPPTKRLVDVLKQNSKQTLERHAAELAAAASSLHAEAIQTRFLRNQFLISPKSLHLMSNEELLRRWHVFGLYKPPFCPMRRGAAQDNYHHVSVESFVESALRSKAIYPVLRGVLPPSEIQVRVLYNLDSFASGPVLVALSNHYRFATSLATTTMEYDMLVSGHLPVHAKGSQTKINVHHLFPSTPSTDRKDNTETASTSSSSTEAYYVVKENGYYSVHPVSLLNVVINAPPTSQPPALERFAREQLSSCVIGDPLVMGELMRLRGYVHTSARARGKTDVSVQNHGNGDGNSKVGVDGKENIEFGDAAAHAAALKMAANQHIVSMRGDCDFPRVFVHLRELRVATNGEQSRAATIASNSNDGADQVGTSRSGATLAFKFPLGAMSTSQLQQQQDAFAQQQGIELHCRKCFDGLVQKQLTASFKARRIGLLDGTWTPQAEFL